MVSNAIFCYRCFKKDRDHASDWEASLYKSGVDLARRLYRLGTDLWFGLFFLFDCYGKEGSAKLLE